MAGTRDDLAAATNTAMQAREGTRFCHCVEMTFGEAIRARPGDATKPDTEVVWTGRGDLTRLHVYTSVDDGLTWQRVARSGDPIPNLAVNPETGAYSAAHAVTTNRRVAARIVFEGGANAVIDSFTVRARYEDGSTVERVETGASLANDRVVNVRYDAGVGGLMPFPDVALRFHGNRGGLVLTPDAHDGDGAPAGLHLSHGSRLLAGDDLLVEWQADEPTRRADAAMAFEGWFYAEQPTGVLLGWLIGGTRANWGTLLDLVLVDGTPQVRFRAREWPRGFGGRPGSVEEIGEHRLRSALTTGVELNRWHHVAFTYDGFWATMFLNGVVAAHGALKSQFNLRNRATDEAFGIVIPTNGRFVMGRSPLDAANVGSTATSFAGSLSEWRFYAKKLSPGTVIRRARRRLEAAEVTVMIAADGLRAYYPFDQGGGTTVLDHTGVNHLQWHQQQVGATRLPPQLAWLPMAELWRGFPSGQREVRPGIIETRDRSPGRQTAPLDLDVTGDAVRATDAPFDVTFDGKTFTGVGEFGGIDTVQEAGDLTPTAATLRLSGIQQQHISLALSARYLDRPCRIWQVTWDDDGVQLAPFLVFEGKLDELRVALGRGGTVEASAESHLRNWRRPKHRRWNDESQRALWSDDKGLQFLGEMVDREVWWPVRLTAADSNE